MQLFSQPNAIKHLFNSPSVQDEITTLIQQSKVSLKIAVTWFTNRDLFNEIIQKLNEPNYQVDLIVLNDRINNKKEGVDFQQLIRPNSNFYYSDTSSMVHHKFCIIDEKIVVTGSYNWTYYAENRNWENVLVLSEPDVVSEYIKEFDRVIEQHKGNRVDNVISKRKFDVAFAPDEYLKTDYLFQARNEEKKGNVLTAAKIYTEALKIDNNNQELMKARNTIISKYNNEVYSVAPFEIGILFNNGYSMAIPAYAPLPFTSKPLIGLTTSSTSRDFNVTVQKVDVTTSTKIFTFNNLVPQPENTPKIEYILHLEKNGILTVTCKELNGRGKTKTEPIDLKNWC